jgi:hypothetical protein
MTQVLKDKDVEALTDLCSTKGEFLGCIKVLATAGYLMPLAVLQYCFEGNGEARQDEIGTNRTN